MRFNPTQVCVGYVVDKMALGQVVLLVIQHSPRQATAAPHSFSSLSPTL